MACGLAGEAPGDQRLDDGLSLVFDSKELADRTEILGAPELVLELASDSPTGQICVRLSDVAPDGSATRVSWQVLNLTHRAGHEAPSPLTPGVFEMVRVKLNDCAHSFRAGHRIRLAVSTAAWPTVWPAQDGATLTLRTGASAVILPVRRPRREDALIHFDEPVAAPAAAITALSEPRAERRVEIDLLNGASTYVTDGDAFGAPHLRHDDIATEFAHRIRRDLAIRDRAPESASQLVTQTCSLACEGKRFRVEATAEMTATRAAFHISATVEVFEDDRPFASRRFEETIARDLV
jgi:hypothetical protein